MSLVQLSLRLLFVLVSSHSLAIPDNMSKRRILVTGANSGIGLALTKQLVADHGCHVYLGSRNAERGMQAVEEVKATSGNSVELLTIVSCDLSFLLVWGDAYYLVNNDQQ
jgi:nucleoside-diphosphate-sugar epimerase